ncbi:dihydropyrimidinase [Colletotrichum musicola]|uniref:dihydropyrimidinase n=1 Tax=Colletotrichum musicola TaxID=2175873 RepID=A0A8H6MTH0_9PEZI|nr:dihydropyrimidinase [Colletotrichum musicola]
MEVDLIVENATVVTASDIYASQDIVVRDGKILAVGQGLKSVFSPKAVIDAHHGFVMPGGVDSHVHLDQDNSPTGDNFETGTRSAIAGGTTTVIAFATQERYHDSLHPVVEDYHSRSRGKSYCDYGFHLILTNPTPTVLHDELPHYVSEGISSVKLYMTYDPLKLNDGEILDVMMATRSLGMTTMVHAENSDMISWITARLAEQKLTAPYYHAVSRPSIAEDEATYRVIALAELSDVPVLIVHMSSRTAAAHVRAAQTRLLPVHAETCPHYLYLTADALRPHDRGDDFSGAKHICSPPLREDRMDLEAMWAGVANGTFTTFSSDHAPSKYDHPEGKKKGLGEDGGMRYDRVPNGLPGVETRMPLLFKGVLSGQVTPQKFVEVTSANPAKLYGLGASKGAVAAGYDADFVIWYPTAQQAAGDAAAMKSFVLENSMLHHDIDYSPFEGMSFDNWPRYTILRGRVVWDRDNGGVVGEMGYGDFLRRGKSTLSKPRNKWVNEFQPMPAAETTMV